MLEPPPVGMFTTRTKIGIGAGLLVLAVVVLVRSFPAKPAVEVRFVRYADRSAVVLRLTNRARSLARCIATNVFLFSNYGLADQPINLVTYFDLMPRCSTNLVGCNSFPRSFRSRMPSEFPGTVFVRCRRQPSDCATLRRFARRRDPVRERRGTRDHVHRSSAAVHSSFHNGVKGF
jgi:hypothetical protein